MITVKKLICLFSLDQISLSVDNSSAPCYLIKIWFIFVWKVGKWEETKPGLS